VDPRTHYSMGREAEQPAEDDGEEHQRQNQPSLSVRLSGRPHLALPVQALQMLHPWILRHALCSGHCSWATITHAAVPGGTHRILIFAVTGEQTVRRVCPCTFSASDALVIRLESGAVPLPGA
jgi:hypothetical protein